jgi:hypothetical protein
MSTVAASPHALTPIPPDIDALIVGWRLSLQPRAGPKTLAIYEGAVSRLVRFLADRGMPARIGSLRRERFEAYISLTR